MPARFTYIVSNAGSFVCLHLGCTRVYLLISQTPALFAYDAGFIGDGNRQSQHPNTKDIPLAWKDNVKDIQRQTNRNGRSKEDYRSSRHPVLKPRHVYYSTFTSSATSIRDGGARSVKRATLLHAGSPQIAPNISLDRNRGCGLPYRTLFGASVRVFLVLIVPRCLFFRVHKPGPMPSPQAHGHIIRPIVEVQTWLQSW